MSGQNKSGDKRASAKARAAPLGAAATLSHEMGAVVRQEFRRSGLHCAIDIPLTSDFGQVQALSR